MSWIESHSGLLNHPKLSALAQAMGWDKFHAFGRLHCLWHWAIEYAPTGDLHRFNDTQLAAAVELDPALGKKWVEALCSDQSRWIDRGQGANGESIFRIHDWPDYAGKFLKNCRWRDRSKWAEVEAVYSAQLSMNHSRVIQEKLTVPNQHNLTNHTNPPNSPPAGGVGFDRFWAKYPSHKRKRAEDKCRKKWNENKLETKAEAVLAGLELWIADWKADDPPLRYMPNPHRFLNEAWWKTLPRTPIEKESDFRAPTAEELELLNAEDPE